MKLTRAAALTALIAPFVSLVGLYVVAAEPPKAAEPGAKISYYKDVRPIFAQHCNGCHQPAKPQGGFIMTAHADLLKAGERDKPGIVPGKPAASYLLEQIKPLDGKAEMPKGRDPLNPIQIQLIADWIAQGAADDTPASAKADPVDAANPPRYLAPPVVTSLDFDAKGEFLAVAGYHEVLLYSAKDFHLVSRLIGISERINTVAFSPNGERLAVAGGSPGRFGEVQVWNPRKEALIVSAPITFDTVYGLSWAPDGKLLAIGCSDNTVRGLDPLTGKQVLQMGTHTDWVLTTVFSQDGVHLVSAGRDQTLKLTEVPTQRFVDNMTSITPGALRGGVMTIDRRPVAEFRTVKLFGTLLKVKAAKRLQKVPADTPGAVPKLYDEVLAAGSDGRPRLYMMHREKKREIGDDSNRVREYEPMPGRISTVAFSPDGKHFAAVSSLDGKGEVRVYETDSGANLRCDKISGPAYTVAWTPDGKTIASAGFDGKVWIHKAANGELLKEFTVLPRNKTGAQ
ncbi:MAG TPA: c-type cytochrome domain-containing protein [Urbifossiella sp.]|nr:c-type cytochrome domain-containing protein [Urbifossiella sp.]